MILSRPESPIANARPRRQLDGLTFSHAAADFIASQKGQLAEQQARPAMGEYAHDVCLSDHRGRRHLSQALRRALNAPLHLISFYGTRVTGALTAQRHSQKLARSRRFAP